MKSDQLVKFAAVGDIHCTKDAVGKFRGFFAQAADASDGLLLCGDLTDYGLPDEAKVLADELAVVGKPIVAVLGNHDFESNRQNDVRDILTGVGVRLLDGEACEIEGIGIAGAKGFAGGFGRSALGAWGEPAIKLFVEQAIQEALKLESALAKLRTPRKIALLHYAPIRETVVGEPDEIFAFLGTSRLEDPLLRHPVDFILHGHAHRGSAEGVTTNGIPVWNVAMPLLKRIRPDQPPFRIVTLPRAFTESPAAGP